MHPSPIQDFTADTITNVFSSTKVFRGSSGRAKKYCKRLQHCLESAVDHKATSIQQQGCCFKSC